MSRFSKFRGHLKGRAIGFFRRYTKIGGYFGGFQYKSSLKHKRK